MNRIEIKRINKTDNWKDFEWFIDGIRFSEHLKQEKRCELPENVEPFDDLCPAWTRELDFAGDVKFVWHLVNSASAIVPVYMCPEDLDFSCIVIVVEVEKTEKTVCWKRAGFVNEKNYDFQEEKRHGILCTEAYSESDWEKYGGNIALAEIDSDEWLQWISKNWEEELFRRRMNYTYRNYQQKGNILWFAELNFQFDRTEYEMMVKEYMQYEENNSQEKPIDS